MEKTVKELLKNYKNVKKPEVSKAEAVEIYYEIRKNILLKDDVVDDDIGTNQAEYLINLIQFKKLSYNKKDNTITLLLNEKIKTGADEIHLLTFKRATHGRLKDVGVDLISLGQMVNSSDCGTKFDNLIVALTSQPSEFLRGLGSVDYNNCIMLAQIFLGV